MNDTAKTATTPVINPDNDIEVSLEQLLTHYMPREKLRAVVLDVLRRILLRHAGAASPIDPLVPSSLTAEHVAGLRDSAAIALPPALCTLMARLGFDKSLFTYGHAEGRPVGFAEGYWLLRFVGLADEAFAARQRMTSAA